MNVPITIHKDLGKGSSSNLGIETVGNINANCLCARDYKGISRMGANAVMVDDVKIRKLTPRECWRLQGFPDEYFDKAVASGTSNSQLYKQAGNGVSVNIALAIGLRLKAIEDGEKSDKN